MKIKALSINIRIHKLSTVQISLLNKKKKKIKEFPISINLVITLLNIFDIFEGSYILRESKRTNFYYFFIIFLFTIISLDMLYVCFSHRDVCFARA